MIRSFVQSRKGNFALMIAVTLPVLLGAIGYAVDVAILANARTQLQNATDAAALAASRLSDKSQDREAVFQDFLRVNLANAPELLDVEGELDVDEGVNTITTQAVATADVRLYFPFLFGKHSQVKVRAGATESSMDIEVAMVLDNTGSMGSSRMSALRGAAKALADILEVAKSPNREVRASLVPFVTAVNVNGKGFKKKWIDRKGKASYHGANFDLIIKGKKERAVNHLDLFDALGVEWKGCVEARPEPYNFTDAEPDKGTADTLFVPYFAPDEPGDPRASPDSSSKFNNTYLADMALGSERERQRSILKYNPLTPRHIAETGPKTTGPNFACPTPIEPLTGDFDRLRGEIAKMIYWNGSGTNVSEGLAWGMRVLSPEEPYDQGAPYNSPRVSKSVVVFTDGENNVFGASSEAINKSDYGSYSFVDQGRIDEDRGQALKKVNEWTLDVCDSLKDKGVTIFTVLLGADSQSNRDLYSACASKPSYYYPTSDVNELETIFQKIGSSVTQLYITN